MQKTETWFCALRTAHMRALLTAVAVGYLLAAENASWQLSEEIDTPNLCKCRVYPRVEPIWKNVKICFLKKMNFIFFADCSRPHGHWFQPTPMRCRSSVGEACTSCTAGFTDNNVQV